MAEMPESEIPVHLNKQKKQIQINSFICQSINNYYTNLEQFEVKLGSVSCFNYYVHFCTEPFKIINIERERHSTSRLS